MEDDGFPVSLLRFRVIVFFRFRGFKGFNFLEVEGYTFLGGRGGVIFWSGTYSFLNIFSKFLALHWIGVSMISLVCCCRAHHYMKENNVFILELTPVLYNLGKL